MTLSNKTINNLASAMLDEVIRYIHEDERYANFMMELIPDAIHEKFGTMNEDLLHELAFSIMDRMCFKKFDM